MTKIRVKILEHMAKNDIRYIKDLQEKTGISKLVLSDLINGKRQGVRMETIVRLCEVFNCSVDDLVEVKDDGQAS